MAILVAFIAGFMFGMGLIFAGMANPAKILGFLDLAGIWDPSMPLVMAGAISVGLVSFAFARTRTTTAIGLPMQLASTQTIDARLVGGSVVFGVGWGLAGFCPGPAIVALGAGYAKAAVFVAAMLLGMGAFELIERLRARADGTTQEGTNA